MEQEQTRLREVEAEMNAILERIAALEEVESQDSILSPEDIAMLEKGNNETEEQFMEEASEDEAEIFLGENPSALTPKEITWKKEIMDRVKIWTEKGLTISKEEKQKLITSVPRKGKLNLEAPALNDEIAVDLTPKALTKDTYFREYQNLAGAGLSASTYCLNIILNDMEEPIDREARRSFLIGRFEEKIQKVLRKVEPTEWLFGDNLKTLIENTKAVEKTFKLEELASQERGGAVELQNKTEHLKGNRFLQQTETVSSQEILCPIPTTAAQTIEASNIIEAGRLKFFYNRWKRFTQDQWILDTVRGYSLDFQYEPSQVHRPQPLSTNEHLCIQLDREIEKLVEMKAVEQCLPERDQFISTVFLVPKPDDSFRFILNLKDLNNFVKKEHFKLEDLRTVLNLINKNDFMCRLDLRDAYLSVPIRGKHRKFFRFEHRERTFQFKVLPFGLSSAPFVFTKLLKPGMGYLRERGVKIVVYLDDFLIMGQSQKDCENSVSLTISLLRYLGFLINWKKCILIPNRICKFLGMVINSSDMTLELTADKRVKIKSLLDRMIRGRRIRIQTLMECVGILVAACPGVAYGWIYYKELERLKQKAYFRNGGDVSKWIILSSRAIEELNWWSSHILISKNNIRSYSFHVEIFSDASSSGWGAVCRSERAQGLWNREERNRHINYLEIRAAFLALKCFAEDLFDKQILLRIDNLTALSYINKMGGTRHEHLNTLTRELWEWCISRRLWVFAEYVVSKDNIADEGSRLNNVDTEWKILHPLASSLTLTAGIVCGRPLKRKA